MKKWFSLITMMAFFITLSAHTYPPEQVEIDVGIEYVSASNDIIFIAIEQLEFRTQHTGQNLWITWSGGTLSIGETYVFDIFTLLKTETFIMTIKEGDNFRQWLAFPSYNSRCTYAVIPQGPGDHLRPFRA